MDDICILIAIIGDEHYRIAFNEPRPIEDQVQAMRTAAQEIFNRTGAYEVDAVTAAGFRWSNEDVKRHLNTALRMLWNRHNVGEVPDPLGQQEHSMSEDMRQYYSDARIREFRDNLRFRDDHPPTASDVIQRAAQEYGTRATQTLEQINSETMLARIETLEQKLAEYEEIILKFELHLGGGE